MVTQLPSQIAFYTNGMSKDLKGNYLILLDNRHI